IIPLITICVILFLVFFHEELNWFPHTLVIGSIIAFLIMSYLSFRLKIIIDYTKKIIYVYSFKTYVIKFDELINYDFSEENTIDGNHFVKLNLYIINQREVKVTLSFSAATRTGWIGYNKLDRIRIDMLKSN